MEAMYLMQERISENAIENITLEPSTIYTNQKFKIKVKIKKELDKYYILTENNNYIATENGNKLILE